MLTTEEINVIAADVLNGRAPRIVGPEADAFRREFAKDVAKAEANGWQIELPAETPVHE